MTINQLRYLLLIHQQGSINKAAQKSNISPQNISIAIKKLEEELGCPLFNRDGRKKLVLSEYGQVFIKTAEEVVSSIDSAVKQLETLHRADPAAQPKKSLNILISPALGLYNIPGITKAFLQQYPGIELELSSSDRLVDIIREGFDCVVRVGALKDSGLIARPLGKLTQINCASPDYLARFGYPQSLEDLADHALIHYASTLGVRPPGFEVMIDGAVRWVKTGGILTVNSTETYQAACIAGLGIIQVPRTGVREALRAGDLIEILPQYRAEPLPVSLIYPHRRNLSRRVNLFMEWLGGLMKAYVD